MAFDANVIQRQFGEIGRPWHHFRIRPNDSSFDSTNGLQDAVDSGGLVNLPRGIIYSDMISFAKGGKLRGQGVFNKFRDSYDDDELRAYTLIRYNGGLTSNTALFNLSLRSNLATDATVSDLRDVGFSNLTLDCNGNSIAAGGSRNADGANTIDVGAYFDRCGNNQLIAEHFSVIGAGESGIDMLALFSATVRNFAVYECVKKSVRIGYNYRSWATGESIVHRLSLYDIHIRNNGDYSGVGGGDSDGVWAKATPYRGAAIMIAGRACKYSNISYEVNGGPLAWGGAGADSAFGGRGSESSVLENVYIEANESGSAGSGSPDEAVGFMPLVAYSDIGFIARDIFLNGGNAAGKPQQTIYQRNVDFNANGVEQTAPGVDATHGPANVGQFFRIENAQSIKGTSEVVVTDFETAKIQMRNFGNTPMRHDGQTPYDIDQNHNLLIMRNGGELTIATGAITVTHSRHTVDTEADAASDDLDTISGGVDGQIVFLSQATSTRDVVLKNATGNIYCDGGADITLSHVRDVVMLIYDDAVTGWKATLLANPI